MTQADGDQQGRRHQPPLSSQDYDFFYEGIARGELLVQRCGGCDGLRNPPSPVCPTCHSLDWSTVALGGEGVVHSYTVHHHPPLPDYAVPHPIAIVDMPEGVRMVGAMDGTDPAAMAIGQRVRTQYVTRGDVPGFRFIPVEG
ncbi:MAG TPA: OB-fold domain-containing protein [Sphingobium sp.]|nr:OB-fold domain-containing protein [Sphingobium sp.]